MSNAENIDHGHPKYVPPPKVPLVYGGSMGRHEYTPQTASQLSCFSAADALDQQTDHAAVVTIVHINTAVLCFV